VRLTDILVAPPSAEYDRRRDRRYSESRKCTQAYLVSSVLTLLFAYIQVLLSPTCTIPIRVSSFIDVSSIFRCV